MGDRNPEIAKGVPRVSVILPVINGEKTIQVAVSSILAQTFPDFELIVLDDGSTDRTPSMIRMLNDPRLRFVCDGVKKGLAMRLNEGVYLARGEYIARMDGDDVAFPQRLERQVAFLSEHPDMDLIATQAIVFKDGGRVVGKLPFYETHADLTKRIWSNIPMPHPTWMGRAAWFKANPYRIPEVRRAEDQELLLRCLPFSRYATLPEVLLGYRQGAFDIGKVFAARHHLLRAQMGLFLGRRQYGYMILAMGTSFVKIVSDSMKAAGAALALPQFRCFGRRGGSQRPQDMAQLDRLLKGAE